MTIPDLRNELRALSLRLDNWAQVVALIATPFPNHREALVSLVEQLAGQASTIRLLLGEELPTALTLVEEMYREPGGEG